MCIYNKTFYKGQASDIEIHANEILSAKKKLTEIMAEHCDRSPKEIQQHIDRDNFMSAHGAKKFGLIDSILEPSKKKAD